MLVSETERPFTSIGGQAVIEGVMMRSPRFIATAVRRPNGRILIRYAPVKSITQRFPQLKKPVLRGVITLVESMIYGVRSLSYSANVAIEESVDSKANAAENSKSEKLSNLAIASSMLVAFLLGMGLFVALPHALTLLLGHFSGSSSSVMTGQSPFFHLIDGAFKMAILLLYVYLIGFMNDIRRVFQYHGAEHKSIFAFEAGKDLTPETTAPFTCLHPRCGTSFLLFLVVISILVFSALFPLLPVQSFSSIFLINHLFIVLVKIGLMFPVAGISYEFIKASASRMQSPFFRALIWPGLTLQNLTTREPDHTQLEVALASLRQVLRLEKEAPQGPVAIYPDREIEIQSLDEIPLASASVKEFAE